MTGWSTYRLFGVNLATEVPLSIPPGTVDAAPDVIFHLVEGDPDGVDWSAAALRYQTPVSSGRMEPDFHFFTLPDRDVIRITGAAEFHLSDRVITCHLMAPEHRYLVEIALFGLVLAFWLERGGTATYHASAVALSDDAAVAFLAAGGTGKSSLAAGLVNDGASLVTEDLLVPSWEGDVPLAEPGLPQLRLRPESAARYTPSWERLDQPHPAHDKRRVPVGPDGIGAMATWAIPLRRLYVLERDDTETGHPSAEPVRGRTAVVELLRHSYLPHEAERFGWQARRLGQVARLLGGAPLRRLRYPSGVGHLPAVRATILEDLATCGQTTR